MKVTFCMWCGVTPGTQNECFANRHHWMTWNDPYCHWCGLKPCSTPTHCTASKHHWQESPRLKNNNQNDKVGAAVVHGIFSTFGLGLLGDNIKTAINSAVDKNDNDESLKTNATIFAIYRLQEKNVLTFDFLVANLSGKDKLFETPSNAIIYISKLIINGTLISAKQDELATLVLNPKNEIVKAIVDNNY